MSYISRTNLYLACVIANFASFSIGNCFTWSSPTLPKLLKPNDILLINEDQSAWMASLITFGAIFGPFVVGVTVDRVGHKWCIALSVSCVLINWVLLLVVRSVPLMYTARIIGGVGAGMVFTVVPMYVAECAEDRLRGMLGSLLGFFLNAGFLLAYLVGPYVSYTVLILCSMLAQVAFLVLFHAFMPQTPYYLLRKGRDTEALRTLYWLRKGASNDEVNRELHQMKMSVNATQLESGTLVDLFSTPANRRALLISAGLVAGEQLSGINVVLLYTKSIFLMTGSSISPDLSSIIFALIQFLSAGLATPLVSRFGMKLLLIISAVGMTIFQGVLGLYFFLQHLNIDVSTLDWLPTASLIGYIIMYSVGFGPLPWAVMAEMFPSNIKAIGSAVTTSFCWLIGFLMSKFFVDITTSLGEYTNFWMFAFFCFFMVFFTIFLLPDTRGKSFGEIQDILNNRSKGNT